MKRLIAISGIILAAFGLAWGGWIYYQNSLSREVRAAVLATLGDNTSYADAVWYLRAAKLASRTKRDFEVVGRMDKMLALEHEASEDSRLSSENTPMVRPLEIDKDCKLGHKESCAIMSQWETVNADNEDSRRLMSDAGKQAKAQAQQLMVELRIEMRLPPLQEHK